MRIQKSSSKQLPQVLILGVLTAGALGYCGITFLGSGPKKPSGAASLKPASAANSSASLPNAPGTPLGTPGAPGAEMAQVPAAEIPLPSLHNPDPFKPAAQPDMFRAPRPAQPAPAPGPAWPNVPALPPAGGPEGPQGTAQPPVEQGPVRPDIAVTGVIDAEDGKDMALVAMGSDQRIIQVGDMLPNNYRVKRITLDGVLLVNGKDRFFVTLGAKTPAAPGQTATRA
jgi:hypothetical protein